jgi:hypothetical protein
MCFNKHPAKVTGSTAFTGRSGVPAEAIGPVRWTTVAVLVPGVISLHGME